MQVLFARAGALGDFLLTLPVLERLLARCGEGRVDVLTRGRYRPLLPPGVGRVWEVESCAWAFGGRDPIGYDAAFTFSPVMAESLRAAGIPEVRSVAPIPASAPAYLHYGRVLEGWAGEAACVAAPRLPWVKRQEPRIAAQGARPKVVISPGSGGAEKRQPIAWWREVAAEVSVGALGGAQAGAPEAEIVWVAGPVEEGEEGWPEGVVRPDLAGLLALAGEAAVWGSPDAGPAHLAAAAGVPTAVVFLCTDPRVWAHPAARVFGPEATPGEVAGWMRGALQVKEACAQE